MTRDWVDYWNLAFSGIGATITLLTAVIAVISFFIARRSRRDAAAAKTRADAAKAAADKAEAVAERAKENETRTYGYLSRALRVFSRTAVNDDEALISERELLAPPEETDEERAERERQLIERLTKYNATSDRARIHGVDDIIGADSDYDSIDKIIADMERDADNR